MKKKLLLTGLLSGLLCTINSFASDWEGFPVPADAGEGKVWQLQKSHSDDFNYQGKNQQFKSIWKDNYMHNWKGPGLTHFSNEHSDVYQGNLVLKASRRGGTEKVNTGIISSLTPVTYPVYMEASIKVANLELSSNFWLLSADSTHEIDILEVYGGTKQKDKSQYMGTNFHVFFRGEGQPLIDHGDSRHYKPEGGGFWREDYHRFGVHWESPTEVTFYIDGKITPKGAWKDRVLKTKKGSILDKTKYSMNKPLHLILDLEDHDWRSKSGHIATDEELANQANNKMYIDWVRVYKPQ
jgi:agarase